MLLRTRRASTSTACWPTRTTYEIMTPESVGLPENAIVLGKHSGKHAFAERLRTMGYVLDDEKISFCFEKFKELADRKKEVTDLDLRALVELDKFDVPGEYILDTFVINSGNKMTSMAVIKLQRQGEIVEEGSTGDGPVDAAFNAIDRCIGESFKLEDYIVRLGDGRQGCAGRGSRQAARQRQNRARPRPQHRHRGSEHPRLYRRDQTGTNTKRVWRG